MILETFLILAALPFVGLTLFFGSKNGYMIVMIIKVMVVLTM